MECLSFAVNEMNNAVKVVGISTGEAAAANEIPFKLLLCKKPYNTTKYQRHLFPMRK